MEEAPPPPPPPPPKGHYVRRREVDQNNALLCAGLLQSSEMSEGLEGKEELTLSMVSSVVEIGGYGLHFGRYDDMLQSRGSCFP